jgi:hypothetical protein
VSAGAARRASLALLVAAALTSATGCGSSGHATPTGLRVQREELIATAQALAAIQPQVDREAAAAKAAWPALANGLPSAPSAGQRASLATAVKQAAALKLPALFEESAAQRLTGPASGLASNVRRFAVLTARGWRLSEYAIEAQGGGAGAAKFARSTVALYIESVYDAHFGLAQIGKALLAGYEKLGGPSAFGAALSKTEVERLAGVYSEARYRLHPHPGVQLGA